VHQSDLPRPAGLASFMRLPFQSTAAGLDVCLVSTAGVKVCFETSFNSKQSKLKPKLVLALSETKRLFRLFRFYTETESFDVSIEPKQREDQPKQFDREHIFRQFWVVLVCFSLFRNSSVCFCCFDIGSKHRNKQKFFVFGSSKQTATQPKQILFRFVSVRTEILFVCFEDTLAGVEWIGTAGE
jgi:hypothetical protein